MIYLVLIVVCLIGFAILKSNEWCYNSLYKEIKKLKEEE